MTIHGQGRAKKVVQAQKLWFAIVEAQVETGNPYMLYKVRGSSSCTSTVSSLIMEWRTYCFSFAQDACNRKSNQQNLGTIKSSNLCTEILEYSSPEETAVCNLASIALPRFVREQVCTLLFRRFYLPGVVVSELNCCSILASREFHWKTILPKWLAAKAFKTDISTSTNLEKSGCLTMFPDSRHRLS